MLHLHSPSIIIRDPNILHANLRGNWSKFRDRQERRNWGVGQRDHCYTKEPLQTSWLFIGVVSGSRAMGQLSSAGHSDRFGNLKFFTKGNL